VNDVDPKEVRSFLDVLVDLAVKQLMEESELRATEDVAVPRSDL
jgi:hypothetical protein